MSQFCSLSVIKSINHPGRWWSPTVRREMCADSYKINMFFRKHLSRAGVEFSSDPTRITHTLIIIIQVHYVPVRVIKLILTLQSVLQRSNAFEHWSQRCYFCKKSENQMHLSLFLLSGWELVEIKRFFCSDKKEQRFHRLTYTILFPVRNCSDQSIIKANWLIVAARRHTQKIDTVLPARLCQKAICFHGDRRDVR